MLRIIEGYEMTGKSTLIRKLKEKSKDLICWSDIAKSFGINSSKGSHGVGYTGSWIIGATVAHLGALGVDISKVILDRGILSSMVYGKLMDGFDGSHLERYLEDLDKIGAEIVYVSHSNKETAKLFFDNAQRDRNGQVDEYDPTNFEDYWEEYQKFDREYLSCLSEIITKYNNIDIRFVTGGRDN